MDKSNNIYILSGQVHSGKSNALMNWIRGRTGVCGILTPDVNGKRLLTDISNGKTYPFQLEKKETPEDIMVGKYIFSAHTFLIAQKILMDLCKQDVQIIVVDEIGKLEMQDQGFEPALGEMIQFHHSLKTVIIAVIRDYLLDQAILKYNLQNARIITTKQLNTLNQFIS